MRLAIEVIWWIGLVGALVPTLVILKEAFLVIGTLRGILRLAESTHVAAQGISVHMHPAAQLRGLAEIVRRLNDDVRDAAQAMRRLAPGSEREGEAR